MEMRKAKHRSIHRGGSWDRRGANQGIGRDWTAGRGAGRVAKGDGAVFWMTGEEGVAGISS
jgi:hypothetical protein